MYQSVSSFKRGGGGGGVSNRCQTYKKNGTETVKLITFATAVLKALKMKSMCCCSITCFSPLPLDLPGQWSIHVPFDITTYCNRDGTYKIKDGGYICIP